MSDFVGTMLGYFQRRLSIYHNKLVHIEGGLGSQILGAMIFWNLQEKIGIQKARCDLSYFSNGTGNDGLWPYELNRFNLPIEAFRKFEKKSKGNLLKAKRDFLNDDELTEDFWKQARAKYEGKFAYESDKIYSYFKDVSRIDTREQYAAIHVRRGDYVQVASKLIQYDEYFDLIASVYKILPSMVFVISDSEVSRENRVKFQALVKNSEVKYLDSPELDPFYVHCLLREAKVLVTANSTYSFSAGLLGRRGQTVISPMQFHGGVGAEKYNKTFQSAGSFFIWPQRD